MGVGGGARGGRGGVRLRGSKSEGTHESVGADGDEELPVSQASQEDDDDPDKVEDDAASATEEEDWEEDNERLFGYDLDREVDVWAEYQAAIEDPLFAL